MTEKELQKLREKLRTGVVGRETIKVIYLGKRYGGFHYGKVIEAKSGAVKPTREPFPLPKNKYCNYEIRDEDGDLFLVSHDGIMMFKGFYLVPDSVELGSILIERGNFK